MVAVATPPQPAPRVQRLWYGVPFAVPFILSTTLHGTMFVGMLLHALLGGGSSAAGESGAGGAGDTTIDISVAGAAAPAAAPSSSSLAPQIPDETPPAPTTTAPAPAPAAAHPRHDDRKTESRETVQGTGAEATHTGRMEGTSNDALGTAVASPDSIAGQRGLLPAAMKCDDPVAGRWEAMKYDPLWGIWVRFTLSIHHVDDAVTGTITSRTWFGGPGDRIPPSCDRNTQGDFTVRMVATGTVDSDQNITFGSSSYTLLSTQCPGHNRYAPDNFSGTIDPVRQEFQSVNNDGAHDINSPYVFRRTSCRE